LEKVTPKVLKSVVPAIPVIVWVKTFELFALSTMELMIKAELFQALSDVLK